MGNKALNWTEIRARYESGEPPRVIAKDYTGCTPKAVSNRATKQGWRRQKEKNEAEIVQAVHKAQKDTLSELCSLTESIHLNFLRAVRLKDVSNPYLPLEEARHNPLFQTMLNNASKIYLAKMRYELALGETSDEDALAFTLKIQRQTEDSAPQDED